MTALDLEVKSADLLNALMDQKDVFRVAINKAEDDEMLRAVLDQLAFVSQVWKAVGYGYKVQEIRTLAREKAERIKAGEVDFIEGERKNSSARRSTLAHIARLNALIESLK